MISMNFVKDYIDIENENLEELADKVTKAGINVEHVITNHIDNLVIGEVVECVEHPDSDHLHVCKVNIGTDTIQIVCGAPNVREGLKVIVALPGAKLPEIEIKKGSIRGVESNGMICALFELGLEEKTEENFNRGIEELDKDAPIGEDAYNYLANPDTLYDLDIHKHKSNDCLYHIGFAYEIGTILGKKVKLPKADYKEIDKSIKDEISLKVDTDNCTYYKTKMVEGVKIGESPKFIQDRLVSCGMRSINNVVDISNYVMLEYGQPLHFFDKDKLGNTIVVRQAKENEKVTTLDEIDRELNSNDIVITDGKDVVAIAGVMGALNTDVDDNTTSIVIESAIFNSYNIRKTERHLNLRSEASRRFEKYASGKVLKDNVCYDNVDKTLKVIEFTTDRINSLLGLELSDKDIEEQLKKLDFEYEVKSGNFKVTIPRRRMDIENNVNDIAEEIGRLYGYHNLKNTLPVLPTRAGGYRPEIKFRKDISSRCRSLGLDEVRTYSIVQKETADMFNKDKKIIELPNPIAKDRTVLRKTMIPSLLEVYSNNKKRGVKNINIYEISKLFYDDYKESNYLGILISGNYINNTWNDNKIKSDFYVLKGIVENILDYVGLKNRYSFVRSEEGNLHPGISADIYLDREKVGFLGRIHPIINKDDIYVLEISLEKINVKVKDIKYKLASIYPSIKKDLAFIMPKDMDNETVLKEIKKSGSRLLTNIEVFDIYEGINVGLNNKSIAYTLTFSDDNKTLTDEEVMEVFNNIIKNVESKLNVKLRSL